MKFTFSKKQKISIDEAKIETFLNRGVENVYPNKEDVNKKLLSGKKLKVYLILCYFHFLIFLIKSKSHIVLQKKYYLISKIYL